MELLRKISSTAILFFFLVLVFISLVAYPFALSFIWCLFASFTVLFFFLRSKQYLVAWIDYPESGFTKKLLYISFFIRLCWVVFSYFFYKNMNDSPFEFSSADAKGYHWEVLWMLDILKNGDWQTFKDYYSTRLSDSGYPLYLILLYSVFGKSIIITRIIKALIGAVTVVLIYRLTKRNFDYKTARVAAVLAMLYPNLIYYTGLHVKETEMVFLFVAFAERTDFLLRQHKLNVSQLFLILIIGASLYFFRAVLAYSAFVSLLVALLFTRKELFKIKKSLLVLIGVVILILFFYGNNYFAEAMEYWSDRFNNQEASLVHRTQTNVFARYGSAVVFAPFTLIAPFPTMVNIDTQKNHMLLSGAFFVKNVLAYFVISAFIFLYKKQGWKNHIFILALMLSYLSILTMSKFALVERFHLPVLPFFIMFSAFGILNANAKSIKYFQYYLIGMSFVIIGWNWFKLAGRGLI